MIEASGLCERCIHNKVCGFKDSFKYETNKILEEFSDTHSMLELTVRCRGYDCDLPAFQRDINSLNNRKGLN